MFVPKSALAIVSHCDSESSRYALGAVQFERGEDGKAIAVATDGRRLAMLSWPDADIMPAEERELDRQAIADIGLDTTAVADFKSLIPMADVKRAAKLVTAKPSMQSGFRGAVLIDEVSANGKVSIGATDGKSPSSMTVASQDGRFPKWQDVFPDEFGAISITLNPQFLAEACKLLADFATTDSAPGVKITLHAECNHKTGEMRYDQKPVVLSATRCDGQSGKVVIMPLASDR